MKRIITGVFLLIHLQGSGQSLYFPPLTGNQWDTLSPTTIGWCQPSIDSLYHFLENTHTDGFIVLKNGRLVLEKYFGSFTADSVHYWASAGKSLMAVLTGIAQDKGLVNINAPVSNYLGSGWTAAAPTKEAVITVKQLLAMTSGLDDTPAPPCDNENITPACLQYLADTGSRWAYHTGAYQQLSKILSITSGVSINAFTNTSIGIRTGITGLWVNGVFFSRPRSMARFGLLALNEGIWGNDTLIKNRDYWREMTSTAQPFNKAYGYLWWLNGKPSFMAPGLQFVFNGSLVPNAPADMFCALGKNDQKIYVVPSQQMVVIRTGESAFGVAAAFSPFDDLLWEKINRLGYQCQYSFTGNGLWNEAANWANQLVPPPVLHHDGTILIDPIAGGECILNVPQTIQNGSSLVIAPGKNLTINGNLQIIKQ